MAQEQMHSILGYLRGILTPPAAASDRELLHRFDSIRDQDAFAALIQRHGPLVWGVCRRVLRNEADTEDAFQATFLVLARKAGSLGWRNAIGCWLYQTAYHIARRAHKKADIRKRHEEQAAAMLPTETAQADWDEIRQVLDEEMMHLPARYRMALLLCSLHGKTRDEAAQELGWSVGTVKSCLQRGRDMLRDRLTRRGVALSAALLFQFLAEDAIAAVPSAVAAGTVRATVSGTCTASVAALVKGAMQAMFWTKVRIVAAVCAVILVVGAGLGFGIQQARLGADTSSVNAAKDVNEPAWGEALNGIRIGLAPQRIDVLGDATEFPVQVWYENVSKEVKEVPIHADANQYRLMFRAEKDNKATYVAYLIDRSKTAPPRLVKIQPGERLHEEFRLFFELKPDCGWTELPNLPAGKSLIVQAGLCPEFDPHEEKHWKAQGTLISGASVVRRLAEKPAGGHTLKATLGSDDELKCACQTTRTPGNPKYKESVVADTVMNYETADRNFHWRTDRASFQGALPAAVLAKGKVAAAARTQEWNTCESVDESPGTVYFNCGSSVFGGQRWHPQGQQSKAIPGMTLYGKLLDGDETGTPLVTFSCSIVEAGKGVYEYAYVVNNASASRIEFKWAGLTGTVEPGKSFAKKLRSEVLTQEMAETAWFTMGEMGQLHVITAHCWERPR